MPYESHTDLITPADDTTLWRYMDLAKFLHLLESRSLWFSRLDQFDDPLEGTFTDSELAHFKSLPDPTVGLSYVRGTAHIRATNFVSCWREGAEESMAMWDLYRRG